MADVKLYLSNLDERRARIRRRVRIILAILAALLVVGGGVWLLFSPVFRVRGIRVEGTRRVSREAVVSFLENLVQRDSRLAGLLGGDHLFVWPNVVSETDLLAVLPNVKRLALRTSYMERVVFVALEEREPFGIWCLRKKNPAECYWFEYDGTVFEPAPEAEGKLVRVVADYATENFLLGDKVLPDHFVANVRGILDTLIASPLAVREVRYEDPALQEVRVATYDGPAIYFSLRFSPEHTLAVIESLIEKDQAGDLSPRFSELQYIDFRVENRAYYK